MSENELRAAVLAALGEVAPEVDLARLDRGADLRETLEIDSMDFLNLAIGIGEELETDIPESAYDELQSVDEIVAFVAVRDDALA